MVTCRAEANSAFIRITFRCAIVEPGELRVLRAEGNVLAIREGFARSP